jgi:FkbM family methyltransferase
MIDWRFLWNRYARNVRIYNGFRWTFEPLALREDFLERFILQDGECLVDVGANVGAWTLPASRRYKRISAFEANPRKADILKRNLRLNGIGNVDVHPIALGERAEEKELFLYPTNGQDSFFASHLGYWTTGEKMIVQVEELDSFKLRPTTIKIDTEGYELQVLKGALDTIEHYSPKLIVETHDEKDVRQVEELLRTHGQTIDYDWTHIERPAGSIQTILIGEPK